MRLCEMKTTDAFEAMVKMLPHVSAILEDEDVAVEKAKLKENKATAAQSFGAVMPLMVARHGADMIAIAAAGTGRTVHEVNEMPLSDMHAAFDEAWKDVLDFFPLCLRLVANA